MKLDRMSIKNKFILVSAFLLLILVVFSVFIVYMTSRLADITDVIYTHPLEVSNAAYYANIEVLRMHRDMKDIVITDEDFEVNLLVDKVRVAEANVYIALDTINYYIIGDEGKQLEKDARVMLDDWKLIRSEVIEYVRNNQYDKAIEITKNKGADHVQRLEQKLGELNNYARKKAESFQAESVNLEKRTEFVAIAGTITVFILVLSMIMWVSLNVLGGIAALGDSMKEIMEGKDFKDIELRGNDELTALSQVFNDLIQSLGKQLWVRESISQLNAILTDSDNAHDVLKDFCRCLVENNGYLSVAYYELAEEDLNLVCALNRLGFMESHYHYGEHIVGECAKNKEPKFIIYEEEMHFAVSESFPFYAIKVMPVVSDTNVYGVMEMVLIRKETEEQTVVLNEALASLAIHMASAKQRRRIDKLLENSIKANDELIERQTTLEERTEELEEANQALQLQKDLLNMKSIELEEQNKELEKLRQELITKYEDLEELSKYRSQFLANVSHELKTPLNSIILLSSVLKGNDDDEMDDDIKEKVAVINKAGSELLMIINDILDLSKLESGKVILENEVFESHQLIEALEALYKDAIKDKDLQFSFVDDLHKPLYADKAKIMHVLTNFISNALKFTIEGSIEVRIAESDSSAYPIHIEVKDTGIGIEAHKLNIIFDEFVQSDGSISRTYGGTGLGLAICKNYAKVLNGKIDVRSEVGTGSVFCLCLPGDNLYTTQGEDGLSLKKESNKTSKKYSKSVLSPEKRGKRVLICDDEPMNVYALSAMLKEIGVHVVTAMSGEEALDVVASIGDIDLIMVDYMMPGMDGIETIRRIKALEQYNNQPIVMVTAASFEDGEQAFVEMETNAFLQKPIIYNEVVKILERLF